MLLPFLNFNIQNPCFVWTSKTKWDVIVIQELIFFSVIDMAIFNDTFIF